MNFKKCGFISLILAGGFAWAQRVMAQINIEDLGLEYGAQTTYGPMSSGPEIISDLIRTFFVIPIIVIVWIVGIVRFFQRRRAVKKGLPVVVRVSPKKQIINLFIWLVFFFILYSADYFFIAYAVDSSNDLAITSARFISYVCLAFGFFLVIPKLIIKTFFYFKNKKNTLPPFVSK